MAILRYVSVLKAKEAEFRALGQLPAAVRARMAPLFEVQPPAREWDTGKPKNLDEHLATIPAKLGRLPLDGPVLLDLPWIPVGTRTVIGAHPASGVFDSALDLGAPLVPVTGIDREQEYNAAVATAVRRAKLGAAFRLRDSHLRGLPTLQRRLRDLLREIGLMHENVDLIVDVRQVTPNDIATRAVGLAVILRTLPDLAKWRTLTLVGGAFPQDLRTVKADEIKRIDRAEWALWKELRAAKLPRTPDYGDYVVDYPEPFDRDPKTTNVSANIRYTGAEQFVVVKGRGTKKNGWEQTQKLSADLVAQAEFMGATYSAGDAYIAKRANGKVSCGNPTVWRRVAVTHHVTLATDQLSKLGAP